MKKILFTCMVCLFALFGKAQPMIDLEAFMAFVDSVTNAEENNDKELLQQLRARIGRNEISQPIPYTAAKWR